MPHTVGIEIEFILPALTQEAIASAINTAGVPCFAAGYTHHTATSWKVVRDGSVTNGHELVSPVLTEARFNEIDQVCAVLSRLGASVNRTCGLHVHVGARTLSVNTLKRLAALYAESEDVIDQLIPPSRRANNNGYCASVKGVNLRTLAAATSATDIANAVSGGDRRSKLNYTAFWRHGTVEFRQHSGTVDPVKIKNWALFCLKMVDTAQREENDALRVDAVRPATAAAPVGGIRPAYAANPYWRRGRRTRMIYQMLTRPEGASAEEVRVALNVNSAPDIRWHMERAREAQPNSGERLVRLGRQYARGGIVFRLALDAALPAQAPATQPAPPPVAATLELRPVATLDELLTKLQMTPTERTYWIERRAMLSPSHE